MSASNVTKQLCGWSKRGFDNILIRWFPASFTSEMALWSFTLLKCVCNLEHLFKTTHIFEQTSQNTTSLTHTHTNTLFKIFFLPLFYFVFFSGFILFSFSFSGDILSAFLICACDQSSISSIFGEPGYVRYAVVRVCGPLCTPCA